MLVYGEPEEKGTCLRTETKKKHGLRTCRIDQTKSIACIVCLELSHVQRILRGIGCLDVALLVRDLEEATCLGQGEETTCLEHGEETAFTNYTSHSGYMKEAR